MSISLNEIRYEFFVCCNRIRMKTFYGVFLWTYPSFVACLSLQMTLPLSAAVFRGPKSLVPTCPPRLDVQVLKRSLWSRVPNTSVRTSNLKLSDIRGWSMICEEPGTVHYHPLVCCVIEA